MGRDERLLKPGDLRGYIWIVARKPDGKEEEKEHEEEEEKARGGWGYEKWRRDALSVVVWAGMLIWAGLVLLAENMGFLASLRIQESRVEAWSIVFIGAAVIVFLEVLVRLVVPSYRRAVGGTLVADYVWVDSRIKMLLLMGNKSRIA